MKAAGVIFSNLHDRDLAELTRVRTMASVPFGCRYRLIDFPLSEMVNAGISDIRIITHYNYHSLMEHIGSGKDWDLARRQGGVKILPPYITAYANTVNSLYNTRLEALKSVRFSIEALEADYVVLCDCGVIANLNIEAILHDHIESGADITMAVKEVLLTSENARQTEVIISDEKKNVTDVVVSGENLRGRYDVAMNVWVMKKPFLCALILDAISHNYVSFNRDILQRNVGHMRLRVYRYSGEAEFLRSFADYFRVSMKLLRSPKLRDAWFAVPGRKIYTKVRNSAPTVYQNGCSVSDSLIADGCMIRGRVENSILFRGVRVEKDAVVKNSILFGDTHVGEGARLFDTVTDKNTQIGRGRELSGCESRPYYLEKGMSV